ncbi:MAG: heavy-metal-associated domain-containing protein [Hyphomonadaceae bacterium]|nr:heavy-metal-associated domain-containing protein [Hyphomonadaceae bacterium]
MLSLQVPKMSCGGCAASIEKAVKSFSVGGWGSQFCTEVAWLRAGNRKFGGVWRTRQDSNL